LVKEYLVYWLLYKINIDFYVKLFIEYEYIEYEYIEYEYIEYEYIEYEYIEYFNFREVDDIYIDYLL
jgi:hypothetical protein